MEMGGWIGVVKPQEICGFNLVEDVMVVFMCESER